MAKIVCCLVMMLIGGLPLLAQESLPLEALYRVNTDGSGIERLLSTPDVAYWGPSWSHDGQKIAVSGIAVGERGGEIYLADRDGSSLTALTANGRNNYLPAWSPDDQMIAFISQDGDNLNSAEVMLIRADGSGEVPLTNNAAWDYGISWSPDGTKIAFGSEAGGAWAITLINADGSGLTPLAADGNAPTWSPDGTKIAFTSDRDGDDDIYVMNSDGSDQKNLTNNDHWDDQPSWSPDGTAIAFTSDRDGIARIYTMNADGSAAKTLTASLDRAVGLPTWSPDSQQLIFHARELSAEERAADSSNLPLIIGGVAAILLAAGFVVWRRTRS